jgi:hypothetical protein
VENKSAPKTKARIFEKPVASNKALNGYFGFNVKSKNALHQKGVFIIARSY